MNRSPQRLSHVPAEPLAGPGHRLQRPVPHHHRHDRALHGPAAPDPRPRRDGRGETLDRQRLSAGGRRPAARRRLAQRPPWPQAAVPRRPAAVRPGLAVRRLRPQRRGADRRPRRVGGGRGTDDAGDPVDRPPCLPGRTRTRPGHRHLGLRRLCRRGAGAGGRRRAAGVLLVGLGVPHQRPGGGRRFVAGAAGHPGLRRPIAAPMGRPRLAAGDVRPGRGGVCDQGTQHAPRTSGWPSSPRSAACSACTCSSAASAAPANR